MKRMAADAGVSVAELIARKDLRDAVDLKAYVSEEVGMPTLTDIMQELDKPGRDPRASYKVLEFAEDIHTIEDLQAGMELPGIVTNVTDCLRGLRHQAERPDSRLTYGCRRF